LFEKRAKVANNSSYTFC